MDHENELRRRAITIRRLDNAGRRVIAKIDRILDKTAADELLFESMNK